MNYIQDSVNSQLHTDYFLYLLFISKVWEIYFKFLDFKSILRHFSDMYD